MKKTLTFLSSLIFTLPLCANTQTASDFDSQKISIDESKKESDFYLIIKGLSVLRQEADHETSHSGHGGGFDLGYRFAEGFAVEYDFTYGETKLEESDMTIGRIFYGQSLDLIYTKEVTEDVGIFGKFGYEHENEKVDAHHQKAEEDGINIGLGIEYALNSSYKIIAEYEHFTAKESDSDLVFGGVMFDF